MKLSEFKQRRRISIDWKILIPGILLSVLGIIALLSTTVSTSGGFGDLNIVWKQVAFMVVGFIMYFVISFLDLSYLKYWQVLLIIYLFGLILLILTLLIGPEINNVKRWLIIGGIQIQASEIAKTIVVIFTASILSYKEKINQWILFLSTFILVVIYFILIYLEPSGSMSLLTMAIWFFVAFFGLNNILRNTVMLIILGGNVGAFLISSITGNWIWMILSLLATVVSVFGYYYRDSWRKFIIISFIVSLLLGLGSTFVWENVLRDYQKDRIEAFMNPTETQDDTGFNVNQARIAIGSGQIFGKGFGNGTQSKRDFLPEHETDFIFASFAEEFGLVGSLFVLLLYGILITNIFMTAINVSNQPLFSLLCVGIGIQILLEVFINIGTNTGAIPATGIPLPLMSAGGSVTMMTLVSLGLVQNISSRYNLSEKIPDKEILEDF